VGLGFRVWGFWVQGLGFTVNEDLVGSRLAGYRRHRRRGSVHHHHRTIALTLPRRGFHEVGACGEVAKV
jgi:hypothetical protein